MSLDRITGASAKSYATNPVETIFPIITQAELEDVDNQINIQSDSGKTAGCQIVVLTTAGAYVFAIAQGGLPASPWLLSDVTPSLVTPA